MADEPEKTGQEPNLELPSLLGLGRRKKGRRAGTAPDDGATPVPAPADTDTSETPGQETVNREPEVVAPEDTDPLAADPVAEPPGGLAPAVGTAKRLPPTPPPSARTPEPEQQAGAEEIADLDETSPAAGPVVAEEPAEAREQAPVDPPPAEPVVPAEPEAVPHIEQATSLTSAIPPPAVTQPAVTQPAVTQPPADEPAPAQPLAEGLLSPATATATRSPRSPRSLKVPVIDPRAAAVLTGAIVGLVGVLLAFVAARGCEVVRGVGSCGGVGLFALLAILAVEVVLGATMLKAWRITDPTSTSLLGVGLVAVFVLLFLLSSLESGWMAVVIPVLSGLTFLLSWWVTETFVEDVVGG
jgi:hypothetical protein